MCISFSRRRFVVAVLAVVLAVVQIGLAVPTAARPVADSEGGPGRVPGDALQADNTTVGIYLPSVARMAAPGHYPPSPRSETRQGVAPAVYVPVLRAPLPTLDCGPMIVVQNVGAEPAKVALVQWATPDGAACSGNCAGPIMTVCSGLLRPGSTWTFDGQSGVAAPATSAALFSLATTSLAELGSDLGPGDQMVADLICEGLFDATVGSCQGWSAFKNAYDGKGLYAGIPMDKAMGSPLSVYVRRACASDGGEATYGGIAALTEPAAPRAQQTFAVPVMALDRFRNVLHVQNVGVDCVDVQVALSQADSCGAAEQCTSASIAAGEAASVDLKACVTEPLTGTAIVTASGPVAIVSDLIDDWTTLAAANEVIGYSGADASLVPEGHTSLYASLTLSEYNGWDAAVQVANLSASTAGKVKATFFDAAGGIITTLVDWVCPLGSQSFFLPSVADMSGRMVGSVRIESEAWAAPEPPVELSGSVLLIRRDGSYASAYPLLSDSQSLAGPGATGDSEVSDGAAVVSVPLLARTDGCAGGPCDPQVDLSVVNLVPAAGHTDYQILFYDANGLVSSVCQRLGSLQVTYYDTERLGHLSAGFAGGAMISATHWQHPVVDDSDGSARNLVGLAASTVTRADTTNNDYPADITNGQPLGAHDAAAFARTVVAPPCPAPGSVDRPGRPQASGRLAVPLLANANPSISCQSVLSLQNSGSQSVFAAVVSWGAAVACDECGQPIGLWCSPMLDVGEATSFQPPVAARSAAVFTFAADAGGELCTTLRSRLASDCNAYAELASAYDAGGTFAGIDMGVVAADGLTGAVMRSCDLPDGESIQYDGYSIADLGVVSPTSGLYSYELPWLGDNATTLYIQNSGPDCATVTMFAANVGECAADRVVCLPMEVGVGQTLAVEAACLEVGWSIAAWMDSTSPLGVVVAGDTSTGPVSMFARPTWRAYSDDVALNGSSVAYGPLTFSAFQGWETELRVVNLSSADALVAVSFEDGAGKPLGRQTAWMCGQSVRNFALSVTDYLTGDWVGQARVESLSYRPTSGGGFVPPAAIQANVLLRREPPSVATYPLLDGTAFIWPEDASSRPIQNGTAVIALPGAIGSTGPEPLRTRVGIANLVPVDGNTDIAMLFLDSNGLVGTSCHTLSESQVMYVDFGHFGFLAPGFSGGAVISATAWDHQVRLPGGESRNLVGLGAVTVREMVQPSGLQDSMVTFPGSPMAAAPDLSNLPAPLCAGH